MKPSLNTSPISSNIIKEDFNNTDNLPTWINQLSKKNILCRCVYYILIFFR